MWFFLSTSAGAGDWYVSDDATASDANPGTIAAPWRYAPGMPGYAGSAALAPGDVVYFDSAGAWTAGSGDETVLDVVGGVTYDGTTFGTGTRATFRAEGDLYRSVINLMHGDHPTFETVLRGFEVDAGGYVTAGVGFNWPWTETSMTGATKRIEDCVIHGVWSESAYGEYEYGIALSGSAYAPELANVEILDSEVFDISRGGINLYPGNDSTSNVLRNVLVRGNLVYGVGTDPDYAGGAVCAKNHVVDSVVEYNVIRDAVNGTGICIGSHETGGFHPPENLMIRHNVVSGNPNVGILFWAEAEGPPGVGFDADIVGNVVTDNRYAGIAIEQAFGTSTVRILNNSLARNGFDLWAGELYFQDNATTYAELAVFNNVVWAKAGTYALTDEAGDITAHGTNLWYREDGGDLATVTGNALDASGAAGWEPDALFADPGFVESVAVPGSFVGTWGVDLQPDVPLLALAAGSPALDVGTDLGPDVALSINSVQRPAKGGWDLGAWELGAAGGTTAPTGDDDDDATGADPTNGPGTDPTSGRDAKDGGGCGCRSTSTSAWMAVGAIAGLWTRRQSRRPHRDRMRRA